MLHHFLHDGGDGGGRRAAGRHHGGGGHGGGIDGGVGGDGHHLLHHVLHHLLHDPAEPRRDVDGRASQGGVVHRGVYHGGDDRGHGGVTHPLVDGQRVEARRHLLQVSLNMLV